MHVDLDVTTINWCDISALGQAEASGDIKDSDVPNPPTIDFSSDADVTSDTFKGCTYEGDSATLKCSDFSVICETDMQTMGREYCTGTFSETLYVPKVRCRWGSDDST
jgi:hypothetical protein